MQKPISNSLSIKTAESEFDRGRYCLMIMKTMLPSNVNNDYLIKTTSVSSHTNELVCSQEHSVYFLETIIY